MAEISLSGPALGNALQELLGAADIQPGDGPSYELCKKIYSFHVLGAKLAETPIRLAQSKPRTITIPNSPEDRVRKAFIDQWRKDRADRNLFNLHVLKRVYGIASLAVLTKDKPADAPIDYETLWKDEIAFNVLDPLNTAGSLVGDLDPNSLTFLKTGSIAVNGQKYDRTRAIVAMNEEPIYLEWTTSSFGYVGRSVYQRTLYPLKSFLETMRADALVARKAGVLVAAMKMAGSIVDAVQDFLFARKRQVVKDAETGNIIGIGTEERIESLNLQNVNGALDASRKHILENIASGAGEPAVLVTQETFGADFHEGTEDAKAVADYIDGVREDMQPSYVWMDKIIQHRAWNPEFYETIQRDFPAEYANVEYKTAFYQWVNAFSAEWQSLLTEPDSKKAEVEDVRLKAMIAWVEVIMPQLDPDNKARLIQWGADNMNSFKLLFDAPLDLDYEALREYEPPTPAAEPNEPHPFAAQDSAGSRRLKMPRHHAAA